MLGGVGWVCGVLQPKVIDVAMAAISACFTGEEIRILHCQESENLIRNELPIHWVCTMLSWLDSILVA
jgi:hypothetical protein